MKNKKSVALLRKIILITLLVALLALELSYRFLGEKILISESHYLTLSRLIGGVACVFFMLEFSFAEILKPWGNKSIKGILAILPAFVIAVNNFPFVSFFSGDCTISAKPIEILSYALFCLSVGFFEEMAFRGCAFMFFLKKRTDTRAKIFVAVFLSSVIFGVVHLVNLFTSSPGAVFLQIGYSALIGALCTVVLLETKNIWLCVICHGVYNFCGGLKGEFGSGVMWTKPQMIFTAVVAVAVAAYMIWLFFSMKLSKAKELYQKNNR